MKTYSHIIFDLDGTLTDPGLGITNSIIYALKKFDIESERSALYKFIGPRLPACPMQKTQNYRIEQLASGKCRATGHLGRFTSTRSRAPEP